MLKSNTPRTDSAEFRPTDHYAMVCDQVVSSNFARELERENRRMVEALSCSETAKAALEKTSAKSLRTRSR
jgi:hypothetical protein